MRQRSLRLGTVVAVGFVLVLGRAGHAVEDARAFLDALRDQGYSDMALDYIEQLRGSPLCPEDMKDSLDYEAAVTLMTGSLATQDPKLRVKLLDDARDKFDAFLKANPTHALAADARMQLANVLVERAKHRMEQAAKPGVPAEEKKKLTDEARTLLQEAQKVFAELDRHFTEEHAKFPKVIDPKRTKEIAARDEARKNMLTARVYLATVSYEIARTYPAGSKEYKEQMTGAAKMFNDLYTKYKTWLVGVHSRMWEGRCYKELGDAASLKTAETIFEELSAQPDEPPAYRNIKNKSLILWLEMLSLPSVKRYADALKKAQDWVDEARPNEENAPDGLAIRFLAAQAAHTLLKGLKENDPERRRLFSEARRHYQFVSRFDGKHQLEARTRLREMSPDTPKASTFAEARDFGKAALDEMQAADLEMRLTAGQGQLDAKKKEEFEKRIQAARDEAKEYFVQALGLAAADSQTKDLLNDVNNIRYYLTYLHYLSGDLYDAAVLGEFLAKKYSDSAGARPGAKIAMAAWVKLRADIPRDADRSFETTRLTSLAQYIASRWAGGAEAEDAMVMLIRSAVADQDPAKARDHLGQLPAGSAKRPEAEVLVGQALWSAYLRAGRLPEGQRPKQEELDTMVAQAKELLEKGVEGMRKQLGDEDPVDYTLASAVLSLAQIYVDSGEPKPALAKLTDPRTGPVALVAANNPVVDKGNFRAETYKAALRAYVADQQMDKAEETMNALEKVYAAGGADPEAAAKLTQVYISLGLELEKQLKFLGEQKKDKEAQQVLTGFQMFLSRISERPGNSFSSLHWVAETLFSLGAGLDPQTREPPPNAKKYYEQASATYQKILSELDEGKLEAPEGADISLRIRLSKCLRRLGQYKEAMKTLVEVIVEKPMMVDAQIEAAYTYQAWATEDGKAGYYKYAIQGGQEAKKKDGTKVLLVWGWGKLARMVFRSEAHRDIFHEARYNLAVCRFEYAKTLSGAERTETLKMAEQDVLIIQGLFPNMGGPEWRDKYNDLLKRIQTTLGKPAVGLPQPKPPASKPAPTAKKAATS